MKLLVLTAAYPGPVDPQRAIFIESLNRALLEHAGGTLEIFVVAPHVHRADPLRETRHGVHVRRFACGTSGRRLKEISGVPRARLAFYLLSGLWATMRELSRERFDLLLCHWVLPTGLICRAASFLARRPLALFAHGSDINRYARLSPFSRALTRKTLGAGASVFTASRDLRGILAREFDVRPARLHFLPMGVSSLFTPGDREAERRKLGFGDRPELLFVGDVVEEKGVRDLLRALDILDANGCGARLHLAGVGPLIGSLPPSRNGAAPATKNLNWLGSIAQESLASYYRAADLLVLPSYSEGSPVAVMEAHSCGLPVVATRVGGVPDLVDDGATGLLVPPRAPEALAAAIGSLLAAPERLAQMRRRLAERPPDHRVDTRAREMYPLLLEAARGRAP